MVTAQDSLNVLFGYSVAFNGQTVEKSHLIPEGGHTFVKMAIEFEYFDKSGDGFIRLIKNPKGEIS